MISKYLASIAEGKPISARSFMNSCKREGISNETVREVFTIESSQAGQRNNYLFKIVSLDLYEKTFFRFLMSDEDDKVDAALKGSSKRGKTSGGILNLFDNYRAKVGHSIVFKDGKCDFEPPASNTLLVIENLNVVIKLLPETLPDIDIATLPMAYGKGLEIASPQFHSFLTHFDKIICFFDYDLGGLKVYKSLYEQLGNRVTYYLHPQLDDALNKYGQTLTNKQYLALSDKAVDENSAKVVRLLLKHKKWLEQEILQAKLLGL
jgi:hypothetical protein